MIPAKSTHFSFDNIASPHTPFPLTPALSLREREKGV
jgi:hypothetical protein